MSEFDSKARSWDSNPIHWERSESIAENLLKRIPVQPEWTGLEFGAGTGILSFILADYFASITMVETSSEMVQVMLEKIADTKVSNLKPVFFDLTQAAYPYTTFDCIFSQMALHHVMDIESLIERWYNTLNKDGYLAIADLYREDGSFHGDGFTGHNGFEIPYLEELLLKIGFKDVSTQNCFVIQRQTSEGIKEFPVFTMVAIK